MAESHKCPICGKYEFEEYGSYDICEVCGWQDDPLQLKKPDYTGGANIMSLNHMKKAYSQGLNYTEAEDAFLQGKL